MKASLKLLGIVVALVLLAGVMAYLAGFFEEKIPTDFSGVIPSAENARPFAVQAETRPLIEQAAGTLRAKVETVISPIITATISSIAVWAGDEVKAGDVLLSIEAMKMETALHAERDGVIADVLVAAGDQIDAKDLLVVYE